MEKLQSRSPGNSASVVSGAIQRDAPGDFDLARLRPRAGGKSKPSRDAVARCIHIWAAVYRLHDDDCTARDLQMPPRAWFGRTMPRLERFE